MHGRSYSARMLFVLSCHFMFCARITSTFLAALSRRRRLFPSNYENVREMLLGNKIGTRQTLIFCGE